MDQLLITPARLHDAMAATVVFDCRFSLADPASGKRGFRDGHIPGAFHLDMETDLAGEKTGNNGRHPLPLRDRFQATLRAAGVDQDSDIVVYDTNRLAGAARAWWLLRYFGLTRVRLLDGGFAAWREAGYPVATGDVRAREPGGITLAAGRQTMVARRGEILSEVQLGGADLVDARESARYAGHEEPIDPVAGRIPGARNLPWIEVTDQAGRVASPGTLLELWQRANVGDDPVVYCGSGITASVVLLARELAGLPGGRLYAGSWSEWCAHAECPIERSTQTGAEG